MRCLEVHCDLHLDEQLLDVWYLTSFRIDSSVDATVCSAESPICLWITFAFLLPTLSPCLLKTRAIGSNCAFQFRDGWHASS